MVTLTQKGKYDLAVRCFLKAINIEPLLEYTIGLARTYRKLGKRDKIEKLYRDLLDRNLSNDAIDAINVKFATLLQR